MQLSGWANSEFLELPLSYLAEMARTIAHAKSIYLTTGGVAKV